MLLQTVETSDDVIETCHVTCNPQKVFCPHLSLPGTDLRFEGVSVVQDFISEEREREIIQAIDKQPWVESQSGRKKQVGVVSRWVWFA